MKDKQKEKPVLAIETSANLCSVCCYFNERKYYEFNIELKHSHSQKIFEAINVVTQSADIDINDYEYIAITSGPGSFTGLRIGMSAAKGIALGAGIPILPVPTFEALALQISEIIKENTEFIIANKVNREEVYFGKFKSVKEQYKIINDLTIVKSDETEMKNIDTLHFGNAIVNSKNKLDAPYARYIAKWSKLFGKDLLTYNFDFLEPNYLKQFIIKERKNA